MRHQDRREAELLLSGVLDAVQRGDLAADGPAATSVAHRLEGALLALRASSGQGPGKQGGLDAGR